MAVDGWGKQPPSKVVGPVTQRSKIRGKLARLLALVGALQSKIRGKLARLPATKRKA